MNDFDGRTSSGVPSRHPVLNILVPLAILLPVVIIAIYYLYGFFQGFEFYHPLEYGPFHSM